MKLNATARCAAFRHAAARAAASGGGKQGKPEFPVPFM